MRNFLFGLACCLIAAPVFAQTVEQDGANDPYGLKTDFAARVFLKYHRAIHAEEECNDHDFSAQEKSVMEDKIAERMSVNSPEVAVGAARLLTLGPIADRQMDKMIDKEGCDGPNVTKALHFFDQRLANQSQGDAVSESVPVTAPQ